MIAVKVTFLNDELTEAQLQRGVWWWKRLALVRLVMKKNDHGEVFKTAWRFAVSGEECGDGLARAINDARTRERFERLEAKDWYRPSSLKALPRAQVIK